MRALFLGLGGLGQRHMRNLLALRPDVQVGAVRSRGRRFEIGDDLRPDDSVDIVEKYGITCFADLEQGLEWRPDMAVVANPSSMHVSTALALVQAKIPVLLEKPAGIDLAGPQALADAADKAGVPVMVGLALRFHPLTMRLLEWMDAGVLGRIQSAAFTCRHFLPFSHPWERMDEYYLGRRDLGGGVVLSEIHSLDLLDRLFGLPSILWCRGGRAADYPGDAEDTATAVADYGRDGRALPVSIHMSLVERPPERRIEIFGERGRIDWRFHENRAVLTDEAAGTSETLSTAAYPTRHMFVDEMRHFLHILDSGADSPCALRNTLGAQAIATAMLRSLHGNCPETFPTPA